METQPYLDRGCNGCPANCHEYSFDEKHQAKGNCGDTRPQGGCYGLIFVPYRNPDSRTIANIGMHVRNSMGRMQS